MKKILNKIFFKLGYVPFNKDKEFLWELMLESSRRNGELLETDEVRLFRVKIAAKSWFT